MKTKILIGLIILIVLGAGGIFVYKNVLRPGPEEEEGAPAGEENKDCIYSDKYDVKLVMPTVFGLPAQFALLPNGDISIADFSNDRILLFSEGEFKTVASGGLSSWAVAAFPDGRIVYAKRNGEVILLDYKTEEEKLLGKVPSQYYIQALAADKEGNVYAGTRGNHLYRLKNGNPERITDVLPFPDPGFPAITDIAVGADGTVYVAGFNRVVAVDPAGAIATIADGLNYEPVWVEVSPDGLVYINELAKGLQRFNPQTKELQQVKARYGFGDMVALTADNFIFYDFQGIFYKLNTKTNAVVPLYVNAGNNFVFAVATDDSVFFATPPLAPVLKQHMVKLRSDGARIDLSNLEYETIFSADVDNKNRLHLLTNIGIVQFNDDGSIQILPLDLGSQDIPYWKNLAIGPDGWYVITTDLREQIKVFSIDKSGKIKNLPINFTRDSFGKDKVYEVSDARIDVASDGSLVLFVTAKGSASSGPYLQRVYRADKDGLNLREIVRLDSSRIAGMVDIAVGPNDDIFVLTMQGETGGPDPIYRIDQGGKASEAVHICAGRDPKGIDVDSAGNIWFGSTLGVFKATPKAQ
jgi:hypothetical protein